MSKQDVKYMAVVLFIAVAIFIFGCMFGYVYVIVNSQAYCVDDGNTLVMVVDGREYQYTASHKYYERRIFSDYDAHKFTEIEYDW